jgi:hypothetical protein
MKNFNDTIGNRTHDFPACSAVPQPTAPPRITNTFIETQIFKLIPVILEYALLYRIRQCFFFKLVFIWRFDVKGRNAQQRFI